MSGVEQAPEAGAETEAPQVDLSNIEQVIDGRIGSLERTITEALGQREQPVEEPNPYDGLDRFAPDLGLNIPSPEQEDDTAALRALADLADQRARTQYEQQFSPQVQQLQHQIQEMRARDDLRELQSQYPDLTKPEVHDAVVERLQGITQTLPQGVPVSKEMVALAYKAWQADQMATDKGSGAVQNPSLENPMGAGPEGTEMDWSQRLLHGAGAGDKAASFWGFNGL